MTATDEHTLPYHRPSDPAKRHSHALTDGPDRAGARAMLKAIGFTDDDLSQPIIGVATTWIETMPCNINQRRLATFVKDGIRAAGGTPMEFNTIAVSDGVSMGTEGMKASLVSREVIADSIELVARGHLFDGIVCLVGCDKTIPAGAMALGRLDIPGLVLYNGTIYPGTYKGKPADVVTVYEAIGAYRAGKITLDELYEAENGACPGAGACGGQFTANTMATVLEFLGLSPAGLNAIPAEDERKDEAARQAGELVMHLVRHDIRPSSIVTRQSFDNAIASVAATGGSTNAVLHLPAIAHEFGIPLSIDEFGETADRTPLIADMRPGGRYSASDMYDAGGVGLVMRELLKADKLHGEQTTVDGRTIAQIAADTVEAEGQQVVHPIETPIKPVGGLTILHGSLAPEGSVVKLAGHERRFHRGPARVYDSEQACFEAVKNRQIVAGDVVVIRYEGPDRRAGHAGDAERHGRARRRGPGRERRAAHRRPLLGRHPRADDRARRARGRARRADRADRGGRLDRRRRRRPRAQPRGRRGRPRRAARPLVAARAALPDRRAGEVRGARLVRVGGRDHQRRPAASDPREPHRRHGRLSTSAR